MPSQRKRIGFLPSKEVHEIIEALCIASEFSQSKVTGLLVEEALRSRGVLCEAFDQDRNIQDQFINFFPEKVPFSKTNKPQGNEGDYTVNKKLLSDNIKMMHEFIEYKYFKKIMKQNNNIIE